MSLPPSRGHSPPLGSPAEVEVGADVEADCREGADEHALHISGRSGNITRSRGGRRGDEGRRQGRGGGEKRGEEETGVGLRK